MEEITRLVELLKQRRQYLIEKTVQIKKVEEKEELIELYKKAGEYDEKKYCFGDTNSVKFAIKKESEQEDFAIIYEDKIIGFVSIWNLNKTNKNVKSMAIALDKNYRGNSIAKYALNEIIKYCFENHNKTNAIMVTVNSKNKESKNLIKNTEFKRLQISTLYMEINHHYEPLQAYRITRKKYERNKANGK